MLTPSYETNGTECNDMEDDDCDGHSPNLETGATGMNMRAIAPVLTRARSESPNATDSRWTMHEIFNPWAENEHSQIDVSDL